MTTKDQLLLFLKERKGTWVSGEFLSNCMGVSRSAIWKQVSRLRKEGYEIESSPKKGYVLKGASGLLLPQEIREGLGTCIFGKEKIWYLSETDSTNTRAKELAAAGAPEGTLIVSETQIQGRGRKGRWWFSPPKTGIYVSMILRPLMPPVEAARITLLTGVAVTEALRSLIPEGIYIKWPNDILINGRKVAGILTEISTEMDAIEYMVVGLGINVNTVVFPARIRDAATSIRREAGKPFSRAEILRLYLRHFERLYHTLNRTGFNPVMRRWKEFSKDIGTRIAVKTIGGTIVGEIRDFDDDGALLLEHDGGKTDRIISGDITYI